MNTATGECTLTATRTITKIMTSKGETYDLDKDQFVTQQVQIKANDITGSKSKDEADLYAAGGSQSKHYEWQGGPLAHDFSNGHRTVWRQRDNKVR